ncbi:MAG: CopG family transcriptional regulator [Spirochaetota bacterium]|nr:CopG family transcriptional regulator [Spirochaetota bacterium]
MSENKQDVITFKVDSALAEIIRMQPNISDFIRKAVLSAIENSCPLCQGTGIITPQQKLHWESFLETHKIEKCNDCDAVHLVCSK